MTDVDVVWGRYVAERARTDRDRLIVHYAPLVRFVSGRIASGLPSSVDRSELTSSGMFGLIDAISKFEPGRGYKFETYAMARVRGAIFDELRSSDWVPRSVRSKARAIDAAHRRFEAEHHRRPDDTEAARLAGMSADQYRGALAQVAMAGVGALDEQVSVEGESARLGDLLADGGSTPDDALEEDLSRRLLAGEVNLLPQREKLVLSLYYYEGLTLAEIGRVLGVTESRVCQIHTRAVAHLRSRLAAADRDPPRRLDAGLLA